MLIQNFFLNGLTSLFYYLHFTHIYCACILLPERERSFCEVDIKCINSSYHKRVTVILYSSCNFPPENLPFCNGWECVAVSPIRTCRHQCLVDIVRTVARFVCVRPAPKIFSLSQKHQGLPYLKSQMIMSQAKTFLCFTLQKRYLSLNLRITVRWWRESLGPQFLRQTSEIRPIVCKVVEEFQVVSLVV